MGDADRSTPIPPQGRHSGVEPESNGHHAPDEERLARVEQTVDDTWGMIGRLAGEVADTRSTASALRADVGLVSGEMKVMREIQASQGAAMDRMSVDIAGIAKSLGVTRTFSGALHLSLPPNLAGPASIRTKPSDTGHNIVVDPIEVQRIERMFAKQDESIQALKKERDDERLAKAAVEKHLELQKESEAEAEARREAKRRPWALGISLAGLVLTVLGGLIGHFIH